MDTLPRQPRFLGLALTALLLAGCGGATAEADAPPAPAPPAVEERAGTEQPAAPEPEQTASEGVSLAAAAAGAQVTVHESVDGPQTHTFDNPTPTGVPLTFMVVDHQAEWVQVQLPVRPNGSTGWVPVDQVRLLEVPYRLEVSTADNEVTLFEEGEPVATFPAATGTGDTPTPTGTYYLTELIAPTNEGYGPYAYGISAHSEVLSSFGAGPGQIGLHGTEEEDTIGQAVSHGCIRLANEDITTLAELLPLGTPIVIT